MELPTTLLRHDAPPDGTPPHYDWLVLDPLARRDSGLGLWTVRAAAHWRDWAALGRVELTPLPRHRRRYLSWEGQLTGQRGWVRRAGTGRVTAELWTPGRIELILHPNSPSHATTRPLALSLRPVGSAWHALVRKKP
ncbi:MAG: hypothetical protein AAF086_08480 [Planctomycetota bacterium]